MELQDWDGELFANVAKANNVYPVKRNVILPKAGFAAWTTEGEDPTHEELVERLGKVAKVATRRHECDADDPAPMAGSPVFQDCSCVSRERRRRYDDRDRPKKIPGLGACAACVAAKSCRSVLGSSSHRHSGAKCPQPTKPAGRRNMSISSSTNTVGRCTRAHCDSSRTHQKPSRYPKLLQRTNPRKGSAKS